LIIGLVGFIGSGKGTVGDMLMENGFVKDSFAAPLKDAVSVMFGWPREMLEGDTEVSRNWRELPDKFWSEKFGRPFTPREALQLMGTEAGRDVFHKDIWVMSLLNRSHGKNVVVTDVRFKNEIQHIKNNGGYIVRIKRGPEPVWYELAKYENLAGEENQWILYDNNNTMEQKYPNIHRSEWDWVGCEIDYVLDNNSTINSLGSQVDKMLTSFKQNGIIV
jgi:hypothetical protein